MMATVHHLLGIPHHLALADAAGRPQVICPGERVLSLLWTQASRRSYFRMMRRSPTLAGGFRRTTTGLQSPQVPQAPKRLHSRSFCCRSNFMPPARTISRNPIEPVMPLPHDESNEQSLLPREPIQRIMAPLNRFCTWKRPVDWSCWSARPPRSQPPTSPFADSFLAIWKIPVGFTWAAFSSNTRSSTGSMTG